MTNSSPDTSPKTPDEQEVADLIALWRDSDPEVTLREFLYLTHDEYDAYATGHISAAAVIDKYHARSH